MWNFFISFVIRYYWKYFEITFFYILIIILKFLIFNFY